MSQEEPPRPVVLIVDDDPDLVAGIALHVRRWGCETASAANAAELESFLAGRRPDVVLLDVLLGEDDGSLLVPELKRRLPDLPVIMITRVGSVEVAVRSMKHGASDYITKPIDFERLRGAVDEALELGRLARRPERDAQPEGDAFYGLVGRSAPMRRLYGLIERLASADVPALVVGETGTGKELVARAIHQAGARRGGPFVAVNAAAIPHELIESQLFGHEKGAFTGALRQHVGYCEEADHGTLFLDEIAEMSFEVQAKLLRFLQDRVVRRLGARTSRRVDVRVLAATNVDPMAKIAAGGLREDLYYRLRVVSLELPPLRRRAGDVELLAGYFLERASRRHGRGPMHFSEAAMERLVRHSWPGNVRELENVVEEAVVLHRTDEVTAEMLAVDAADPVEAAGVPVRPRWNAREAEQRRALLEALERTGWMPEEAARELSLSRATVYRRMKKYGFDRREPG